MPTEQQVISCKEYEMVDCLELNLVNNDLSLAVDPSISRRFFSFSYRSGRILLQPRGIIGIVPLNESTILKIEPRVPVSNIERLIEYIDYSPQPVRALRNYQSSGGLREWMLEIILDSFLEAMDQVQNEGLYRQYVEHVHNSSSPRGTINFRKTLAVNYANGQFHKAWFHTFERTIDNIPNQVLKEGLRRAFQGNDSLPAGSDKSRRKARLDSHLYLLRDVLGMPDYFSWDSRYKEKVLRPLSKPAYGPALDIAEHLISGTGLSLSCIRGPLQGFSLVLEMEKVFEEFSRVSLSKAMAPEDRLFILDGNSTHEAVPLYSYRQSELDSLSGIAETYSEVPNPKCTPDILVMDSSSRIVLIADVKYKPVQNLSGRSDVEQVVTYCTRYECQVGVLIHPTLPGQGSGLVFLGAIGRVHIFQYRLDLSNTSIPEESKKFSTSVTELIHRYP